MLLYRPVLLAYRDDRAVTERFAASNQDSLLVAVSAAARGDQVRARTALAAVDNRVDPVVPTPDLTLARAKLWVDLGDNARASRTLDSMLDQLRFADTKALSEPGNAASLVRAMILRAELARKIGDRASARRWAVAAGTLWSTADKDLAPDVRKLSDYGWVR
jgi:hypothetical protein